jgi:hypothetical protein
MNALRKVEEKQKKEGRTQSSPLKNGKKDRYWIDILIVTIAAIIIGSIIGTIFIKISSREKTKPIQTSKEKKVAQKVKTVFPKTKEPTLMDKIKKSFNDLISIIKSKKSKKEEKAMEQKPVKEKKGISQKKIFKPAPQEFKLTGIMWDKQRPMAIINDKLIKKGDKVKDLTVVEIKESEVILESEKNRYILTLE